MEFKLKLSKKELDEKKLEAHFNKWNKMQSRMVASVSIPIKNHQKCVKWATDETEKKHNGLKTEAWQIKSQKYDTRSQKIVSLCLWLCFFYRWKRLKVMYMRKRNVDWNDSEDNDRKERKKREKNLNIFNWN